MLVRGFLNQVVLPTTSLAAEALAARPAHRRAGPAGGAPEQADACALWRPCRRALRKQLLI